MADDVFDETEETLDDLIERLENSVNSLVHVIAKAGEHTASLVDALVSLDPGEAVDEVASGADDAITDVANAGENAVGAGVDVVKMPVDVVQDVSHPLTSSRVRRGLKRFRP